MFLRSACLIDGSFFLGKKQKSWSWNYCFNWQITGISKLSDVGLKEFCCICFIFDQIVKNMSKWNLEPSSVAFYA
jgi:hypothetical protein